MQQFLLDVTDFEIYHFYKNKNLNISKTKR